MRGRGADIDADAAQVRVRPHRTLVIMAVVAVAVVFVCRYRHVANDLGSILRFIHLNEQIRNHHFFSQ
jgi:hypothetical protein